MAKRRVSAIGAAVVLVLGILVPTPAFADSSTDLTDYESVLTSLSIPSPDPEDDATEVDVLSGQSRGGGSTPVAVNMKAPVESASSINFTVDYAVAEVGGSESTTVLSTRSEAAAAYIQPTPGGVRVLTAISSKEAPSHYSYTFEVPDGTTLVEIEGGYMVQPPSGPALGILSDPWAVDSAGRNLATEYVWEGKTLTQTVDLSGSVSYPVVIDPYWSYNLAFSISPKTTSYAWSVIHTCFNCYFPVAGAPQYFPAYGEFLPLTVGFLGFDANFNCYMDITAPYNPYYMFRFIAAPGHVDGLGSAIEFTFAPSPDGVNRLYVYASIVNDFGPFGSLNYAYTAGAALTWQQFAENIKS